MPAPTRTFRTLLRHRWALPLAAFAWLLAGTALAQPAPEHNRIYPLQGRTARLPVPVLPGVAWMVRDEAGRILRPWGPAEADGTLRLPPGGWYRLARRDAGGRAEEVGGRFAAGLVVLVTGQSQAEAFFADAYPQYGAFPATATDPPAPPVAALLHDCTGWPHCARDGLVWTTVDARLGARVLLAELAKRLGPVPILLVNGAFGGAGAAELADPASPAGSRLRRVARAVAPASAALILAHGTTDALAGTPAAAYAASLAGVVGVLRAEGRPGMPVLLAPLSPLRAGTAAGARAVRDGQASLARGAGLLPGGAMAGVAAGPDGIHWSPDGVRLAAREAAAALAPALGARR